MSPWSLIYLVENATTWPRGGHWVDPIESIMTNINLQWSSFGIMQLVVIGGSYTTEARAREIRKRQHFWCAAPWRLIVPYGLTSIETIIIRCRRRSGGRSYSLTSIWGVTRGHRLPGQLTCRQTDEWLTDTISQSVCVDVIHLNFHTPSTQNNR